ncbi:ATP-binding cassette domain-containing protein [Glycomyces sp. NPDC049804]|uniref:ATP-binding cassette domain-containing protein n=1 Tax=Glycomyces sp. NPDC049804 TaxID=3154363 RepID=UPI003415DB0B
MSDRSDQREPNDGPAPHAPGGQTRPSAPQAAPETQPAPSPEPTPETTGATPPAPADTEPPHTDVDTTTPDTEPAHTDVDTTTPDTEPAVAADDTTRLQPATTATETAVIAAPAAHSHINGTPFLQARGLTATGRQGPVFTDITLTAGLGQVVALCGDGGEGRSSLLLALTGRFPHRSGALEVDGQTKPRHIRRRFTIAQAGPPIRFDPYATVGTCIKETTTVSNGAATRANINAWLDRLALTVDTGDTYGFLPRIDQIRFAIACAAASRTPAIAVDDADTGLDRAGSERVFDALRTVADAGQLVIAACTRSDPPADTIVDLRAQPAPTAHPHHDRNGGHRKGATR